MTERIVEVEWEDSACTHGWHKAGEHPSLGLCRSVGYVLADDEAGLLLAESLDDHEETETTVVNKYGCTTLIPRSAIRKVTELRR